ncbi:MAG: hypothetical protein DI640_01360 [Sphingomonas taxi]|uniref:Uncharacterized protein n=1 Tax=Sphingomonas taxi TaxID=1549858 RepID=A0A2W5B837_9SPHN|nr:MAG: hypothetical protein DI640_01360 [Sphingomonas taxi]
MAPIETTIDTRKHEDGRSGLMSPFVHPTVAEMETARQIVDSPPVISTYAACAWDEMHDDGQVWLGAIIREAARKAGGKSPRHVVVSMDAPVKWSVQAFFRATRNYAGGIVLGFAPTFCAIGAELLTGDTRGVAVMIGPFWIGFACRKFDKDAQ